jgi:hypothetical protein
MKIVTCISNRHQIGYVHALKASCDFMELELVTLDVEMFDSHRVKTRRLMSYLQTIDSEELIFFTDGYDVVFVGGQEEIIKKYNQLSPEGKILMSADRFCASGPLMPEYFKPTQYGYNYLCSGGFIGKAKTIITAINGILQVMENEHSAENQELIWCDQYEWTKAIVANKVEIILDHNCEIFQTFTSKQSIENLYEFVNNEPELTDGENLYDRQSVVKTIQSILDEVEITSDCRVYNKSTKTYPVQIHYNTKINKLVMFMEPFVQIINKYN